MLFRLIKSGFREHYNATILTRRKANVTVYG